jgi:hypothetical protein
VHISSTCKVLIMMSTGLFFAFVRYVGAVIIVV